jgi:low temperature requirement protein LtrA
MLRILGINTIPHRHEEATTWLELFFDLAYVAILIELGNRLSHDISLLGVMQYLFLFVIVWWSWLEKVLFARFFPTDNIGQRLLTFAYMATMGMMAVNIHDMTGTTAAYFLIAYAASKVVLALMYVKAGNQSPQYKTMTRAYTILYLMAALIWFLIAIFAPTNILVWGIVAVIGILAQAFMPYLKDRFERLSFEVPPMKKHYMRHRFGELTIIVLGEFFIKVITHASERELYITTIWYFLLLLGVSSGLWWLYFDHQEHSALSKRRSRMESWIYIHYPLLAAITAYGVVGNKVIELIPGEALSDPKRWLFCGALALAVACTSIIEWAAREQPGAMARGPQIMMRLLGALALLALAVLGGGLSTPLLIAVVVAIIIVLVFLDITWRLRKSLPEPVAAP